MIPNEPLRIRRFRRRFIAALRLRCRTPGRRDFAPGDIAAVAVVRNELLRLPAFLDHYRSLGVRRFYLIENNSTDGTADYLLRQSDVCLYATKQTFERKEAWIDLLLRRHALSRWCVVVDADELLDFPERDRLGLQGLCSYLDSRGFNSLHTILLDLYPEGNLADTDYKSGEDYFDRDWYFDPPDRMVKVPRVFGPGAGLDYRLAGGMRERVFGIRNCCSKFPLLRFHPGLFLHDGQHYIEGARISDLRGVLYHFKYLQDFVPRAVDESERGEHWNGASEYKEYVRVAGDAGRKLSLRFAESLRFTGLEQMEKVGVTIRTEDFFAFVQSWKGGFKG